MHTLCVPFHHQSCPLPLQRQEDIRQKAEENFARWKQEKARQKKQAVQQQRQEEVDRVRMVCVCVRAHVCMRVYM